MTDKFTGFNTEALKAHTLREKAVILNRFAQELAFILWNQWKSSDSPIIPNIPFHVAKGNSKTGETKSISFLPIGTCSDFARRTCGAEKGKCYALKALIYPNVCLNLLHNTIWLYLIELEASDYDAFPNLEHHIRSFIESEIDSDPVARWHISGDIHSHTHIFLMNQIAYDMPETVFYTYTKSFGTLESWEAEHGDICPNLKILISDWCGYNVAESHSDLCKAHHVAYVDDGEIDYIPKRAFRCKGTGKANDTEHTCKSCGYMCSKGIDVVFPIH